MATRVAARVRAAGLRAPEGMTAPVATRFRPQYEKAAFLKAALVLEFR
jgi:hypothetical protein